jgi:predicted dehydrogenase
MNKVRIVGAGSIGNHLAHCFVNSNFAVEITDKDDQALIRMKNQIYPSRYNKWDDRIKIIKSSDDLNYICDVLVIGTPPNTHLEVALEQLKLSTPKIILIEKPISHPDLFLLEELENKTINKDIRILVGYNHRLTKNTLIATQIVKDKRVGEIISITSQTRESWNGIMKAHPWLNGPQDSYLSSYLKGGGALYEHSHALNLLQYFIEISDCEEIVSVQATMDIVRENKLNYDRFSFLSLVNKQNKVFHVIQDVVTNPPLKELRINGTIGDLIWRTSQNLDEVILFNHDGEIFDQYKIEKTRVDDFLAEVMHITELLSGVITESPLDYKHAITTMKIIAAAFESNSSGIKVNLT